MITGLGLLWVTDTELHGFLHSTKSSQDRELALELVELCVRLVERGVSSPGRVHLRLTKHLSTWDLHTVRLNLLSEKFFSLFLVNERVAFIRRDTRCVPVGHRGPHLS